MSDWLLVTVCVSAGLLNGYLLGRRHERNRWLKGNEDLLDDDLARRLTLITSAAEKAIEDSRDRPDVALPRKESVSRGWRERGGSLPGCGRAAPLSPIGGSR